MLQVLFPNHYIFALRRVILKGELYSNSINHRNQ
jgi:hypothetical protein